jgi:hypothetical protein
VPVTIATRVAGDFDVVYLVFNTIDNLVTQDAQIACFQNAAAHLRLGGRFVIESGVPGARRRTIPSATPGPPRLDLMAQIAGLRLRDRWGRQAPHAVHRRQRGARVGVGAGA